jgi:hypothetical protein
MTSSLSSTDCCEIDNPIGLKNNRMPAGVEADHASLGLDDDPLMSDGKAPETTFPADIHMPIAAYPPKKPGTGVEWTGQMRSIK